MEFISIIVLLIGLGLCGYGFYKVKHLTKIDNKTKEENKIIEQKCDNLNKHLEELTSQEQSKKISLNELTNLTNNMNERAAAAFEQYVDALEIAYKEKEEDFEKEIKLLDNSYDIAQQQYIKDIEIERGRLNRLKATRAAAIEAQLREEQIKKEKDFYIIPVNKIDLKDAKILKEIEYKLNNPRVLRMLIWSSFFQKPMNELCAKVLGGNVIKTGIYKITNQLNNMCYIGQSVDIAKRWKDHAKCGLGIDAPASNKLYTAMQKDGLENFTFELLEECKLIDLNDKEKFYIELYQSKEYGYNSTGGNK